jgi:hypothetical protein
MSKDRVKGATGKGADNAEGRAGEGAGDNQLQVEGTAQQVEGYFGSIPLEPSRNWRPSGDPRDVEMLLNSFRAGSRRIL